MTKIILLIFLTQLTSYGDELKIILNKYCLECHGGKKTKGDVNFKNYSGIEHIYKNHETWKLVIHQVQQSEMPPEDETQMTPQEKKLLLKTLNNIFKKAETVELDDPGPSYLRRLTKKEYNNSIRDIFHLDLNLGKAFPSEGGGGEGFDNNAEVMSISPLMFEKYIQEATSLTLHSSFSYITGFKCLPKETVLVNDPQKLTQLRREYGEIRNSALPAEFQVEKFLKPYMTAAFEVQNKNLTSDPDIWAYAQKKKMNPIFIKHMHSYLADKKVKDKVESQLLKQWYALNKTSTEKEINAATQTFLKGYTKARYITDQNKGADNKEYLKLFKKIKSSVFKMSPKELVLTLDPINKNRLSEIDQEIKLYDDWHQKGIHNILNKEFKKLTPIQLKEAYKTPKKFLSKKNLKNVNWHKAQMVEQKKKMAELAKKHITQLITEAYRRPATNHEISKISSLFEKEKASKGTQAAARLVLIRVFCSPNFLFKIEKAQNTSKPYKISSYELATRLSYFLWSSSPDKELLLAAKNDDLQKKELLDKQVIRMLKDPKAKALAEDFAAQWLQFKEINETVDLDKKRFPEFTKELSKDMFTECVETINYIIQSDSSILQVIDSNYIFANENIARLYGVPNIKGKQFRKINLKDKTRGGIITTPAIMAMTSYPLRTSPILRGNWVISALLGTPTPPPPSNVEELPEDDSVNDGLSIKQRFEKHRKDPTCYSCHSRLDPMGFPLELFDPLGRLRQKSGGHPVDATGELKDGSILNGPTGLKQHLLSKRQLFLSNLSSKALGYALGRGLEFFDQYTVKKSVEQMTKNKYKLSALIKTIVHSKAFQYRRGQDHLSQ